jgi:hypothetical protein
VFSLGGTASGDDKNLSHMFVTRILRDIKELIVQKEKGK